MLIRLLIEHPMVYEKFMKLSKHEGSYFSSTIESVARDASYYQLKGLTYLHLNFFEEIYLVTTSSETVRRQIEGEDWQVFIFMKMRHALLKEVFINEQGSTYTGKFVAFRGFTE